MPTITPMSNAGPSEGGLLGNTKGAIDLVLLADLLEVTLLVADVLGDTLEDMLVDGETL